MRPNRKLPSPRKAGFTLIELLIVMAIIGLLLTIAVPRYFGSIDNSKETALKQSLSVMRGAIDQHLADTGKYPSSLEALVAARYLRNLPLDPITERSDTWRTDPPRDLKLAGIGDVKSGAPGNGRDGTPFATW
jgi:general secretion pathway protein G